MIIAQISDIHAAPDNDNLARFDRALAWLDTLAPDVLVISGDLIDDGQSDCYPPSLLIHRYHDEVLTHHIVSL